ncbi:hypothetical protein D3C81_1458950 [compost metagenome]
MKRERVGGVDDDPGLQLVDVTHQVVVVIDPDVVATCRRLINVAVLAFLGRYLQAIEYFIGLERSQRVFTFHDIRSARSGDGDFRRGAFGVFVFAAEILLWGELVFGFADFRHLGRAAERQRIEEGIDAAEDGAEYAGLAFLGVHAVDGLVDVQADVGDAGTHGGQGHGPAGAGHGAKESGERTQIADPHFFP